MYSVENLLKMNSRASLLGDISRRKFTPEIAAVSVSNLTQKLDEYKIDYLVSSLWAGWKITFTNIKDKEGQPADVVIHEFSYGDSEGLFESMGFPDDNGDVSGYLSVNDVIEKVLKALNKEKN